MACLFSHSLPLFRFFEEKEKLFHVYFSSKETKTQIIEIGKESKCFVLHLKRESSPQDSLQNLHHPPCIRGDEVKKKSQKYERKGPVCEFCVCICMSFPESCLCEEQTFWKRIRKKTHESATHYTLHDTSERSPKSSPNSQISPLISMPSLTTLQLLPCSTITSVELAISLSPSSSHFLPSFSSLLFGSFCQINESRIIT